MQIPPLIPSQFSLLCCFLYKKHACQYNPEDNESRIHIVKSVDDHGKVDLSFMLGDRISKLFRDHKPKNAFIFHVPQAKMTLKM